MLRVRMKKKLCRCQFPLPTNYSSLFIPRTFTEPVTAAGYDSQHKDGYICHHFEHGYNISV